MVVRIRENELKKNLYKNNRTVSRNIRLLRVIKGHKQQDVADLLHMSRSAYFALEKGGRVPDFEMLCILSDFYEINIDYLISFDISDQMLSMLNVDQEKTNALIFIERYAKLSRAGKEQIHTEIERMREYEAEFNKFPWKYEGLEERINGDDDDSER